MPKSECAITGCRANTTVAAAYSGSSEHRGITEDAIKVMIRSRTDQSAAYQQNRALIGSA
jgi:hypothetical protein